MLDSLTSNYIFLTEKDIEMLQDINSLVEEEVNIQNYNLLHVCYVK